MRASRCGAMTSATRVVESDDPRFVPFSSSARARNCETTHGGRLLAPRSAALRAARASARDAMPPRTTPSKRPTSTSARRASTASAGHQMGLAESFLAARSPEHRRPGSTLDEPPLEVTVTAPVYDAFTVKYLETEGCVRVFTDREEDTRRSGARVPRRPATDAPVEIQTPTTRDPPDRLRARSPPPLPLSPPPPRSLSPQRLSSSPRSTACFATTATRSPRSTSTSVSSTSSRVVAIPSIPERASPRPPTPTARRPPPPRTIVSSAPPSTSSDACSPRDPRRVSVVSPAPARGTTRTFVRVESLTWTPLDSDRRARGHDAGAEHRAAPKMHERGANADWCRFRALTRAAGGDPTDLDALCEPPDTAVAAETRRRLGRRPRRRRRRRRSRGDPQRRSRGAREPPRGRRHRERERERETKPRRRKRRRAPGRDAPVVTRVRRVRRGRGRARRHVRDARRASRRVETRLGRGDGVAARRRGFARSRPQPSPGATATRATARGPPAYSADLCCTVSSSITSRPTPTARSFSRRRCTSRASPRPARRRRRSDSRTRAGATGTVRLGDFRGVDARTIPPRRFVSRRDARTSPPSPCPPPRTVCCLVWETSWMVWNARAPIAPRENSRRARGRDDARASVSSRARRRGRQTRVPRALRGSAHARATPRSIGVSRDGDGAAGARDHASGARISRGASGATDVFEYVARDARTAIRTQKDSEGSADHAESVARTALAMAAAARAAAWMLGEPDAPETRACAGSFRAANDAFLEEAGKDGEPPPPRVAAALDAAAGALRAA